MKNPNTSASCMPQDRYGKSVSVRVKNPELLKKIENLPRGEFSSILRAALTQYFEATEGVHYDHI